MALAFKLSTSLMIKGYFYLIIKYFCFFYTNDLIAIAFKFLTIYRMNGNFYFILLNFNQCCFNYLSALAYNFLSKTFNCGYFFNIFWNFNFFSVKDLFAFFFKFYTQIYTKADNFTFLDFLRINDCLALYNKFLINNFTIGGRFNNFFFYNDF